MKNKEITSERINREYDCFVNALIPFGSIDIRRAVTITLEVEEDGDWLADLVNEMIESCDIALDKIDPVYCVYDAVLQEARNEIDRLTGFDFWNDGAEIYTYGNYCATSYDWSNNSPKTIKEKLIENKILFKDLDIKTQWFLTQIEANYGDTN